MWSPPLAICRRVQCSIASNRGVAVSVYTQPPHLFFFCCCLWSIFDLVFCLLFLRFRCRCLRILRLPPGAWMPTSWIRPLAFPYDGVGSSSAGACTLCIGVRSRAIKSRCGVLKWVGHYGSQSDHSIVNYYCRIPQGRARVYTLHIAQASCFDLDRSLHPSGVQPTVPNADGLFLHGGCQLAASKHKRSKKCALVYFGLSHPLISITKQGRRSNGTNNRQIFSVWASGAVFCVRQTRAQPLACDCSDTC